MIKREGEKQSATIYGSVYLPFLLLCLRSFCFGMERTWKVTTKRHLSLGSRLEWINGWQLPTKLTTWHCYESSFVCLVCVCTMARPKTPSNCTRRSPFSPRLLFVCKHIKTQITVWSGGTMRIEDGKINWKMIGIEFHNGSGKRLINVCLLCCGGTRKRRSEDATERTSL